MTRLNQSRRQLIGYVYTDQVDNNIQMVQTGRNNQSQVQEYSFRANMNGSGLDNMRAEGLNPAGGSLFSQLNTIVEKGTKLANEKIKPALQKAHSIYTSEMGTAIRNAIPDSDNTARSGFAGETHMIMKLPNGKNGVANYMGPGTEVIERVRRGDPGRTPSDTVAKRHDIDYVLAASTRDKAKQLQQVRNADDRMINSLKRIKANRGDALRNISAGMRLIQAKKIGEDLGLLAKDRFSGPYSSISAGDSALLQTAQGELTQEGYGILPGEALKMKLIKQMLRKRKKKKQRGGSINISGSSNGQSRSRGLGKTYKLNPKPLVGAGFQFKKVLMKGAVPSLIKNLGLPKSTVGNVNKLIPKILKMSKAKSLKSIMKNISKGILPILAHKHMNKGKRKMSGTGIVKHIKKFGSNLVDKLADELIKFVVKKMSGQGLNPAGGSFFKDFAKGFKMVFKPGAKILGAVATATGVPEVGIPLSVISGLL